MVECLTLLLLIGKVPGLKLGLETCYPGRGLSWLFSVPPCKFRDSILNLATTTSFHILPKSFADYFWTLYSLELLRKNR